MNLLLCCWCKTNQSCHFANLLVSKKYHLNIPFIIKNLNKNIQKMHYLKDLIVWLILNLKKKCLNTSCTNRFERKIILTNLVIC